MFTYNVSLVDEIEMLNLRCFVRSLVFRAQNLVCSSQRLQSCECDVFDRNYIIMVREEKYFFYYQLLFILPSSLLLSVRMGKLVDNQSGGSPEPMT